LLQREAKLILVDLPVVLPDQWRTAAEAHSLPVPVLHKESGIIDGGVEFRVMKWLKLVSRL